MKEFEYDIAFSFLAVDETLAFKLYELLKERVKCFIYSEQQKKLAGRDGEEVFNKVFSEEARIVAVLYREQWGSTPWTKIEETAIRNRGFDEGYNFVTFIPLDNPVKPPKWLPKNRIWVGIDRWGIEGAASALETRVIEFLGQIKELTAAEQAQVLKRTQEARIKRDGYLRNHKAFLDANNEIQKILTGLKELKEQATDNATQLVFGEKSYPNHLYEINYYKGVGLQFTWIYVNTNAVDSYLTIKLFKARGHLGFDYQETAIAEKKLRFDRTLDETIGWSNFNNGQDFTTSERLKEHWMKRFLAEVDKINATQ